jgi:hypothetical protein
MLSWKIKSVVALLAVTTFMEAFPTDADAFIFRRWRERRAARIAYYAGAQGCCGTPVVAAYTPQPACGSCNTCASPCAPACPAPCTVTQQVCNYVPQTCYRTVYRQVPVTVYRPVSTCDPCTGCPRTTMHPCTTMQQVAQRVPVTTYRQVCQLVQRPVQPTCAPAMPVVQQQFAPVQQVAPAAPGCSGCGDSQVTAVTPYTPAPATQLSPIQPTPTPAGPSTSLATPQQQTGNGAANTIPALPQSTYQQQNYQPQSTIQAPTNNGGTTIQGSSTRTTVPYQPRVQNPDIRPLPDLDRAPPLLNPDDRTASRIEAKSVAPGTVVPISWTTAVEEQAVNAPASIAKPKTRRLDASGWQAARSF